MRYEVEPDEEVKAELDRTHLNVNGMVNEALKYLNDPDVDDIALARMFIERGCSEPLAYWMVREAEVRHAPR